MNPKGENGLPIPFSYLTSFNNCILQYGLVECAMQGCKFTRKKKRRKATNIDKVLANQDFMHLCPDLSALALPTVFNDHTLILARFRELMQETKKKCSFQIYKYMAHIRRLPATIDEGFEAITWGDVIYQFMHKLKQIK